MNETAAHPVKKAVDAIQQRLTNYACGLTYDDLSPAAIHAAKVRVIDTMGTLIAGFFDEPCRIVRDLAAQMPDPGGATVIGTRIKTRLDMAALVNGTTARYVEMTDVYHSPGSFGGRPSDIITPVLAAAEYTDLSGRDLITGVVLGYEVFLRFSDVFHNEGFDYTNLACLGTAVAAGKLLGLTPEQLSHCISMAVVPNVILKRARLGGSPWKAVVTGYAGRAGVFAALLARAGMEGPHLPFEGKAGWCAHVAGEPLSLDRMGGDGTPYKILDTRIKIRPAAGSAIASVLAAEKVAPISIKEIQQVTVEVYQRAKERAGTGRSEPQSRKAADHSIPYVVAVILRDGTLTPRSFDDAHLWNAELRALTKKVNVIENDEFTLAYQRLPQQHRARVTVVTRSGEKLIGETGGDLDDQAAQRSDAQIEEKFRGLSEDVLGTKRVNAILDRLWHLEDLEKVAAIPSAFTFA